LEPRHRSVLAQEVLDHLQPRPGETWVDATVGVGGHSRLIAEKIAPHGQLFGLDQDPACSNGHAPASQGSPSP
jgi:16S rRNA (cytosine1402-N4)-methyltransferase